MKDHSSGKSHTPPRARAPSKVSARANGGVRSLKFSVSPLLASPTPPWRSRFVLLLLGMAFTGLIGRAAYVQIINPGFYQQKGEVKYVLKEKLPASRGRIFDRNGKLLAGSVQLPTVLLDSKTFSADVAQRKQISQLLQLAPGELEERLEEARGTIVLQRNVEPKRWQQVQALIRSSMPDKDDKKNKLVKNRITGLYDVPGYERVYPEGEAVAHVVGMTDGFDQGIAGVEQALQEALLGSAGARKVVRDRLGSVIENLGDPLAPSHGSDITLSIDARVQSFAMQRLRDTMRLHGARTGSVVVLDALSGEILALANVPSYDPGNRKTAKGRGLRNVAVTDVFEPGSTMKPFVAAMALDSGRWNPKSPIDTAPGSITLHGRTFRDSHTYGVLTLAEVVQKSSNVGTVKIALQMDKRDLWSMYDAVGFGHKPEISFPWLASGKLRPYQGWYPIEHASMSFGYALNVSLLQLAHAYTVFARDGELPPLSLLKREAQDGLGSVASAASAASAVAPAQPERVAGNRVMSAKTAQAVREMLHSVVLKGGTAPAAQENTLGYSVGGKTGTARVAGKGGYTSKYHAFFVGLAPISNPRLVVAVLISEPANGKVYGGEVAAPLFGQVMQQALRLMNVPNDLDVNVQIKAEPVKPVPETI